MENHSNINNQFIPYNLALELKELGFDEPCFAIWSGFDENNFSVTDTVRLFSSKFSIDGTQSNTSYINSTDNRVSAPLWQQAFDWFRDVMLFDSSIVPYWVIDGDFKQKKYIFVLEPANKIDEYFDSQSDEYETYEEARLECLKKLIEIVKNG